MVQFLGSIIDIVEDVTGGYVIAAFDVRNIAYEQQPLPYRLVHQYIYTQSPEQHIFTLVTDSDVEISNLRFGHSYGYPTDEDLWDPEREWLTVIDEEIIAEEFRYEINWEGQLPYPEALGPIPDEAR
ncbi:MAG: hypothetical protein KDE20_20510 [Caldilineaceae bacterium]|nr:hypothetical protein [Caldilineaceae bacterium]